MSADPLGFQVPLARIRLVSRLMAAGCLAALVVTPLLVCWWWATADVADLYISVTQGSWPAPGRPYPPLDPWQRAAGCLLTLIPVGVTMAGLVRARRCFALFADGVYFDLRVVAGLRGFAGLSALATALGFVVQAPASALLSLQNPAGERFVTLGIGSGQIYPLFFAGMVWLIAAVMAQAVAIARENAEFI
ncbi:DUF2975 domain-containing protein [Azospirillum thermophilum]|uniref:DUF2975 domain-containing protein n=1 Tax=Azospirillum thermophilum TaxID=2202148 RepID=A0A2S2CSI3_9PROT|nr:DUF2975 domain-containing protein [Azospirillum thermophilum]AWK87471.1 hypothetical protein DEW08_15685 [Azospirillum thermophilum]